MSKTSCQGQFVAVPVELFADWFPTLPGNAVKTLLYIIRRTKGWGKDEDAISISQFLHGITRHDGVQVDKGAGVPESSLRRALTTLERCGLIQRIKRLADDGGTLATLYRLIIPGSHSKPPAPAIVEDTPPATETPTTHDPIQEISPKEMQPAEPIEPIIAVLTNIGVERGKARVVAQQVRDRGKGRAYVQAWVDETQARAEIRNKAGFVVKMLEGGHEPHSKTPPGEGGAGWWQSYKGRYE